MIRFADIDSILIEMTTQIGVTLVREQQPGKIPDYPFMAYNILSDNPVKGYQRFVSTSGISSGVVQKTVTEETSSIVSLTFLDRNSLLNVSTLCAASQQWFGCTSGIAFCDNYGYAVNLKNQVENRSIFIEDFYWENKFGYDLSFNALNQTVETLGQVTQVTINETQNGNTAPSLVINS